MRGMNLKKMMLVVCGVMLGLLSMAKESRAHDGKLLLYFGLTTSYTGTYSETYRDSHNHTQTRCVSGTGSGSNDGGTVTISGTSRASGYEFNGGDGESTNNVTIVATPTVLVNKIASINLIAVDTGDNCRDTVTPITPANGGIGATTFTVNVNKNKVWRLVIDFDPIGAATTKTLSYSVVADSTVASGTTCNSTSKYTVTYSGSSLAAGTNINVSAGSTAQFTISNTDSTCVVDAIQFNSEAWDYLAWNSSTRLYTTPQVDANSTFKIRYKGGTFYTVSTSVLGDTTCGSISPASTTYVSGSTQTFSTNPTDSACTVSAFTDNGFDQLPSLSAAKSYTLDTITADHALVVTYTRLSSTGGNSYCQVPAFMDGQSVLKPNVLIIFDTSGSMGDNPYKNYNCTESSAYGSCNKYDGYFIKDRMYTLSSGTYTLAPTSTTLNLAQAGSSGTGTNKGLSGNYLNYSKMRKVDILRYILTGGRVSSTGSARGSATGGINTRYLQLNNGNLVEYGTTDPTGLLDLIADKVRMGLMVFNPNNSGGLNDDGGNIAAEIGSSKATLTTIIDGDETNPGGYTPLAESLYEALRYLQGGTSAYNSYDTASPSTSKMVSYGGTATDSLTPHRVYVKPVQGSCQSNFILIITDGAPTNDTNVPLTSSATDPSDSSLSAWLDAHTATAGTDVPTTQLGKLAYYMRNYNLASGASTWGNAADPSKYQTMTVSTIFSFGDTNGATTLQDAAKFGSYLEDKTITAGSTATNALGTTNMNGIPDRFAEYLTVQPTALTGTGGPVAANTRGYYESDDSALLASQLESYFNSIINNTASGTAAAVANNKGGQRGANMIQALFYPQFPTNTSVKWLGEAQALWYYLDPIVNYSSIFQDSPTDGELNLLNDALLPSDPFDTRALWKAGAMLHKRTAADRNIYTLLSTTASTPTTPVTLTSGNNFTTANSTTLQPLLNTTTAAVDGVISYLRGVDSDSYRSRRVNYAYITPSGTTTTNGTTAATGGLTDGTGVWKLGDIINSTPIVQSSVPTNAYHATYSDSSYYTFINTTSYASRNIVYTGANDGMFHAFRLGTSSNIVDTSNPFRIARIDGSYLGKEEWAFIPRNALPYMPYLCSGDYCHQYLVDGAPNIRDAAINIPSSCSETYYWNCPRKTSTTSSDALELTNSSWRTVVIGSMGLGGASRNSTGSCNATVGGTVTTDCVKSPVAGNGLSSYFALDVTEPLTPKFMWEFSDLSIDNDSSLSNTAKAASKGLGFTTPGTAIIRINSLTNSGVQKGTNGRWFAVMPSGPTGAINANNKTFSGASDQNLKIYIVDLNAGSTFTKCTAAAQTNCNYWVKDTGIPFAFANSINNASIELDNWSLTKDGNFSDSAVFITYTKAKLEQSGSNKVPVASTSTSSSTTTAWTRGGVMRLVTNHDPDPFYWFTSPLIGETNCSASDLSVTSGCIGPITTSVAIIQNKTSKKLWVYFAEGRYLFPGDERVVGTARKLFGVQDPCYNQYTNTSNTPGSPGHQLYSGDSYQNYAMGTSTTTCPSVDLGTSGPTSTSWGTLLNQSSDTPYTVTTSASGDMTYSGTVYNGWFLNMNTASGSAGDERVVSDVTAETNGLVKYTTYTPNTDVCTPGGVTSQYYMQYNSGGAPAAGSLVGKSPIQTSSGGIKLINLDTSYTERGGRRLASSLSPSGMSPKSSTPSLMNPIPSRKIMHIQEK